MIIRLSNKYHLLSARTSVFVRAFSTDDFKMRFKKSENRDNQEEKHVSDDQVMRKFSSNFLLNLPHDVDGTHLVPKLPGRHKTELFMKARNLSEDTFAENFHEMMQNFYISIAKRDFQKLFDMTETRFANKIMAISEDISKRGISLDFKLPETPHSKQKPEDKSYIFDKMFEKGVYIDREKNDNNYDYNLDIEYENEGLRYYHHKYFSGYESHYFLSKTDGKDLKDENNSRYKFKFLMDHRNRSIVFRIF